MARRYESGNHQLAFDRFRMNILPRDCDLNQIACLDTEPFRESRTHERGVVPGQLGDWVWQFLEPAIVSVAAVRSEEHTSELQSHSDLVCRLLLEKKNNKTPN